MSYYQGPRRGPAATGEGSMSQGALTAVLAVAAFAVLVFLIVRTDRGGG